jgi:hypothetical protein
MASRLKLSTMGLVHVARANVVIDRILEPAAFLQHYGKRGFANAGHAHDGYGVGGLFPEFLGGFKAHWG